MRILVSGGTGFIGSHLVNDLLQAGARVVTVSRRADAVVAGAEHLSVDLSTEALPPDIDHVDAIVHLAGSADASLSWADPMHFNRVNALGTLSMLELARAHEARFVLASSQRVYRPCITPLEEDAALEPVDPYGYSKLVAEQWVEMYSRLYALPAVTLRFFSVYGPGQRVGGGNSGVVAIFADRAMRGEPLLVKSADLRDFTFVSDVTSGIIRALNEPAAAGRTYNIASGRATSITQLAELIREVAGNGAPLVVEGESDRESYVADIQRASNELSYEPRVGLEQGIRIYVEQLKHDRPDPT